MHNYPLFTMFHVSFFYIIHTIYLYISLAILQKNIAIIISLRNQHSLRHVIYRVDTCSIPQFLTCSTPSQYDKE